MDLSSILILVGLFVVIVAFKVFTSKRAEPKAEKEKILYHYARKDFIMTRSESDFFKLLVEAAGGDKSVFPQVHLSAIIDHKVKGQDWKSAFKHINGKSVDYVICDKVYNRPLLAIELDDWSHDAEDRRQRDAEVERMLTDAKLPLIRFTNPKTLNKENIATRISEALSSSQ